MAVKEIEALVSSSGPIAAYQAIVCPVSLLQRAGSLTRVSSCAQELFSSFEGALIENLLVKIISF